ncbi:MAG TPA: TylF/MycF/NovP-related O-methyltransferase, partial [Caulobacteraceae bacterium]
MSETTTVAQESDKEKFLSLLAQTLNASLYDESAWRVITPNTFIKALVTRILAARSFKLVKYRPFDVAARETGADWPMFGYTMVGAKRLSNIRDLAKSVVADGIPGDFVECGAWRGGSSIFARAALDAYGGRERLVWLADSFEGMPKRKSTDMADPEFDSYDYLKVSVDQVKKNFQRFDLLDERVKFIKGWFSDSLPSAPIERISILRLDGDYYSSTMDALTSLYDKVSLGGFVIVDDYNSFASCKAAITDFFNSQR